MDVLTWFYWLLSLLNTFAIDHTGDPHELLFDLVAYLTGVFTDGDYSQRDWINRFPEGLQNVVWLLGNMLYQILGFIGEAP